MSKLHQHQPAELMVIAALRALSTLPARQSSMILVRYINLVHRAAQGEEPYDMQARIAAAVLEQYLGCGSSFTQAAEKLVSLIPDLGGGASRIADADIAEQLELLSVRYRESFAKALPRGLDS